MGDTGGAVTVAELVEYCQTQARLLHGRVETLDEEASSLLSEIDEELTDVRAQLNDQGGVASSQSPQTPERDTDGELAALEDLEADLTEKQAVVKAKQTRRDAFEALAVGYLELADQLQAETPELSVALKRLMQFEQDQDAPAYFDDRVTMLEAATEGDSADG